MHGDDEVHSADNKPSWLVLLLGGPSGVGKTTAAVQVAARLGAAWLTVDDLRLALARSGVPIPIADEVGAFDAPGGWSRFAK